MGSTTISSAWTAPHFRCGSVQWWDWCRWSRWRCSSMTTSPTCRASASAWTGSWRIAKTSANRFPTWSRTTPTGILTGCWRFRSEYDDIAHLPGFRKRMDWFLENRKDLCEQISYMEQDDADGHTHRLLAIPSLGRLLRVLKYMLNENEFLSPYGIRSLSKFHQQHPYTLQLDGSEQRVDYEPAESTSGTFGGNSNWRGPIWFPVNYLLVEALERYHHFYGDHLRVECPTGSGRMMNLKEVAEEIMSRLSRIFLPGQDGRAAWQGSPRYAQDPNWRDLTLFYEFFHADTERLVGPDSWPVGRGFRQVKIGHRWAFLCTGRGGWACRRNLPNKANC